MSIKIIQIGLGGWGKNHTRILSQLKVLSAVCDIDSKKSEEFGKKYSVNYYNSIDDLLISESFDAAFVVTPTKTHANIASKLLHANKHVFIEKPMTLEVKDGIELLRIAKEKKLILTCGYIERFNPAVNIVKKLIQSKKYGELIKLEFHRENTIPLHIKDTGIIHDTTVHDIDTANYLFNDLPKTVFAIAEDYDHRHEVSANAILRYRNHRIATISSNWITPKRLRNFSAVCTKAIINSDFITQEIKIETQNKTEIPRNKFKEPLLLEIQSFLGAIQNKNELVVKPLEAINVTRIAQAAHASIKTGMPIYPELKQSRRYNE